jgi:cytochrome c553
MFKSYLISCVLCIISLGPLYGQPPEQTDPAHAARMAKSLHLFKSSVRQALTSHCVKCHGGKKTEGEFNITTRKLFLLGGASGDSFTVGKAQESYLADMLYHRVEPAMPMNSGKLSDTLVTSILKWIDLGAAFDRPLLDTSESEDAWTRRRISQEQKDYWAFKSLQQTAFNQGLHPDPQNPIDHFIAAGIDNQQLHFAQRAKTNTLVRRIFLDTLGMPPTRSQLTELLSHPQDQIINRTIEHVLASPHYGERWARHWLDVARFAESHGFEQDYDRPFAFHYRDFVIKALNQDMPYDQFTRWQLAGDELSPENPLAMMATGFLGAGVFPTQITANEVESSRYDALDDMAATTGTAMLALTIGCARCHDHKFDPIPAADYYRFTSTFTTAVRSNQPVVMNASNLVAQQDRFKLEHQPYIDALKSYEKTKLQSAFEVWIQTPRATELPSWFTPEFFDVQAAKGSNITRQADESFKVQADTVPPQDTFTFEFHSHQRNLQALRIEAFADPTLKAGGPGLAVNGNFQLTDIHVAKAPLSTPNELTDLEFSSARATFNQNENSLHVRTVIDKDKKSGWAVDPQFGKDHAVIVTFAEPLDDPQGFRLRITVGFNGNTKHIMGRFRIAVSSDPDNPLLGDTISEKAFVALTKPPADRTAEDLQIALDWYRTRDDGWQKLDKQRLAHLKSAPAAKSETVMIVSEGVTPIRHHTQGKDFFDEMHFLKRGDVQQKVGQASQGFLQVLSPEQDSIDRWSQTPQTGSKTSNRRTALANWMVDTEHGAGDLLARVMVNRIWHHHFGRGLVASTNDFGNQGQPPSHPDLLDWLANQLIKNDWKLKTIHQLILSSYTYQQSSEYRKTDAVQDPDNRYLWRFSPRRLEGEAIRDSLLHVTGQLDSRMFGAGTLDESMRRRSIYFTIKRSKLIPMLQIFDVPEPLVSQGQRPTTTVAPQALLLLNNAHIRKYCEGGSKQLLKDSQDLTDLVTQLYQRTLSRQPTLSETEKSLAFLTQQSQSYTDSGSATPEEDACADLFQLVICLNEFCYIY